MTELAIHGGAPVRQSLLPYGRHSLDESDTRAIMEVLQSDWLTTGPKVDEFEGHFAASAGSQSAVAFCNGTAALHAAAYASGIGSGDEVIIPAITFVASANCVVYQGGIPVFADVDPETLLLDPSDVERRITPRTRAIIAVDYAGQPCDYAALGSLAKQYGLTLISDACHAAGAADLGRSVGSLADLTAFSFHPVKAITTGEGGMVTTDHPSFAQRLRRFRNHGLSSDHRQRSVQGTFAYQMEELGFNYRLNDLQCALGLSQLRKLPAFVNARRAIAAHYDAAFADMPAVRPLAARPSVTHAYHLYVVRLDLQRLRADRSEVFAALRAEGIGANVHYLPVYLHPFYRERFHLAPGLCPHAEAAYETILSLPIFPEMHSTDVNDVVTAMTKIVRHFER